MSRSRTFALLLIATICALSAGCAIVQDIQKRQATAREERERAELRQLALVEHAVYRSAAGWRKHTYRNKALLSQATAENVSLEISLGEQRGLLLVRAPAGVRCWEAAPPPMAAQYALVAGKSDGTPKKIMNCDLYHSNWVDRRLFIMSFRQMARPRPPDNEPSWRVAPAAAAGVIFC